MEIIKSILSPLHAATCFTLVLLSFFCVIFGWLFFPGFLAMLTGSAPVGFILGIIVWLISIGVFSTIMKRGWLQ